MTGAGQIIHESSDVKWRSGQATQEDPQLNLPVFLLAYFGAPMIAGRTTHGDNDHRAIVQDTLDYAPLAIPGARRRGPMATVALFLAVAGAAASIYSATDSAKAYLATFGGCATGRTEASFQLMILTPCFLAVPAIGWLLARRVGVAVVLCRACLWASIAAWLTATVLTAKRL